MTRVIKKKVPWAPWAPGPWAHPSIRSEFLPVSLHAKARKEDKTSYTNDDLFLYAWAFAGRFNLPDDQRNANLWTFFGRVCYEWSSVPPE